MKKKPSAVKPNTAANGCYFIRGADPALMMQVRVIVATSNGKFPNMGSWINDAIKEKLAREPGK